MDTAFYDAFLSNYSHILRLFQSAYHQANCTALACAIDNYLSTGTITRVSGLTAADGFIRIGGTPLIRDGLNSIINRVRNGANGNHLVIESEEQSGQGHHIANLLKIGENVYYVDGFNTRQPVCTRNIQSQLSRATIFHYSIGLRVRMSG